MSIETGLNYNTQRPLLHIPEYGRHVQQMVDYCLTIAEREERKKVANSIITVMGALAPQLRDMEDFKQKLWTHLFVISNFQLDVDSPYPKPTPEAYKERPNRVEYPKKNIRYGHYGKTIESLVKKGVEMEEGEEKTAFILAIANLMKRSYLTWNRDTVADEVIFDQLSNLSAGKIQLKDIELSAKTGTGNSQNEQRSGQHKKKHWNKNFKKNKKRY